MPIKNPNLDENPFVLRGKSYTAGMLLLINHLTKKDWKLGNDFPARLALISDEVEMLYKNYADNFKADDFQGEKISSLEAANAQLNSLIAAYISILSFHTELKNPFNSLCLAERYAVWKKGRETLNTPVSFETEDSSLESLKVVQRETLITDDDILFKEYSTASSNTHWFKLLPQWQQAFIKGNKKDLSKKSIPSSLRSVPGLANLSYHECVINDVVRLAYFRHATQAPIDLMKDKKTDDEQFRLSCINVASQIRLSITKKVDNLKNSELVILSQSLLSPGKIATFKSRHISDPSDNDTQIYILKEKAIQLFQCALRDPEAQINDVKVKTLFFTPDEQKKTLCYKDFLKKWDLIAQGNKTYQYKDHKPVELTLLSTNNPLNVVRHLDEYALQNKSNKLNAALLLGAVARYLKPYVKASLSNIKKDPQKGQDEKTPDILARLSRPKLKSELEELIKILESCEKEKIVNIDNGESIIKIIENLLGADMRLYLDKNTLQLLAALRALVIIPEGQGVLSIDKRHKPQLRSVAETMIVNGLGGAVWAACKSGKDRTGGVSIANDAAAIYYQQNEKSPQYDDNTSDREDYLNKYVKLFESGHQQEVAAENAPGAKGLVKPNWFVPGDLTLNNKKIRLETQLARLNKPKAKAVKNIHKESFNHRPLKKGLQGTKDKVIGSALDTSTILDDWQRNWEVYSINGKTLKELRNSTKFEDKNDLSEFIETHLLTQIEKEELKKYYKALVLCSFHQKGFPHAFAKVSQELIGQDNDNAVGQPDRQIDFSWSEERKGIQIEEINTYKTTKNLAAGEEMEVPAQEEGYDCRTYSSILLNLSKVKDNAYKLAVSIQGARVHCTDERFESYFFKKGTLLEAFIDYLQSLLITIRGYFDQLIKSGPVLNASWLEKANSAAFFQKSKTATGHEERPIQTQQDRALPSCSNK